MFSEMFNFPNDLLTDKKFYVLFVGLSIVK